MFTGFTAPDTHQLSRDVTNLNGVLATQCAKATHLVVNKIERTAKLLKCISTCDFIVGVQWLVDSKEEGHFKDAGLYEVCGFVICILVIKTRIEIGVIIY